MSKTLHEIIETCSGCPYYNTRQGRSSLMLRCFCCHSENKESQMYSDYTGDSWKAHVEIHESCPLSDLSHDVRRSSNDS